MQFFSQESLTHNFKKLYGNITLIHNHFNKAHSSLGNKMKPAFRSNKQNVVSLYGHFANFMEQKNLRFG